MANNFYTYKTPINAETNPLIDDLDDYLATLTPVISADIQYQKIDLEIYIKIQTTQNKQTDGSIGNYALLVQDNKNYYFYITKAEWKSQNALQLTLGLDTINTFANDLVWTSKTKIERQHKNRFKTHAAFVNNTATTLYNNIDYLSEGLVPNKYKYSDVEVINLTESKLNQKWYLIYVNADQTWDGTASTNYPINLYLVPEVATVYATNSYLGKLSDIDRTGNLLVLILEMPYVPKAISWSGNTISLPTGWTVADMVYAYDNTTSTATSIKAIKIPSTFEEFQYQLSGNTLSSFLNDEFKTTISANTIANLKHIARFVDDPKLNHSELHTDKIAYDSFSQVIRPENITLTNANTIPLLDILFKQSNTLTSNIAFKILPQNYSYKQVEDYEDFIISNRSNEISILNSDYLDYVRTGYNYDRKSANKTNAATWISTASSAALTSGGIWKVIGSGGGKAAAAIAIIGIAVTIGASVAKAVVSTVDTDEKINATLAEKEAEATSIANNNDINIFDWYSNNKLHLVKYAPSTTVKKSINDLFHYCGYTEDTYAIPDTTTRYWFNYIQCTPVFDKETTDTYSDYIENIIARYQTGITVFHHHDLDGAQFDTYDWNQEYENWESFLF